MSAALLPEPTYYLASNGRLMKTDGDVDCTGKKLTIYTADQLKTYAKAYGAAEYKRAVTKAVTDGWVPSAYATFFETAMLGETK